LIFRPAVRRAVAVSYLTLAVFTLVSGEALHAAEDYNSLLIGTWVIAPGDPRFGVLGVRNTYSEDGTVGIVIFDTPGCETPQIMAQGFWSIDQGYLAVVLTQSSDAAVLPPGHRRIEKIVELDGKLMIVQSEVSGQHLYRLRSENCFAVI
jgi:hypothetical protein